MMALWWWIDRWRKSTAYTDMTLEEQGAYRNLLDEATLRGGPLPNDERILAKASGDALAWKRVRNNVLARFSLTPDGWRNNTLDEVITESTRRADKQRRYRNKEGNLVGNDAGNGQGNDIGNPARPPDPDPSPSPDLSPVPEPSQSVRAPIALAGMLPRDHLRHAWCSQRGKCVPDFLHAEFCAAVGGANPGQRLTVFYEVVEHGWPEGPIGDDPVKLWRKEFAAKFPSVAPVTTQGRTDMLAKASREFLGS